MSKRVRNGFVALVAAVMMASTAPPALAQTIAEQDAANAPVLFDVLVMRPIGFVTFLVGTGLFVVSSPLVLVTLAGGGWHRESYRILEHYPPDAFRYAYIYGHHSKNHSAAPPPCVMPKVKTQAS